MSDRAWLEAMLDAERALRDAASRAGLVPADVGGGDRRRLPRRALRLRAAVASRAARPATLSSRSCARCASRSATRRRLRPPRRDEPGHPRHGGDARRARAPRLIDEELDGVAGLCAGSRRSIAGRSMAARTLLQQAVPTTFGLKAAGWLVGVVEARERPARVRLPAQLGGAAGTLAPLGEHGPEVLRLFAAELGLDGAAAPVARAPRSGRARPRRWPTQPRPARRSAATSCSSPRPRWARSPRPRAAARRRCRTSATRSRAVLARACARPCTRTRRVLTGGAHEHERAAGAWHAEWARSRGARATAARRRRCAVAPGPRGRPRADAREPPRACSPSAPLRLAIERDELVGRVRVGRPRRAAARGRSRAPTLDPADYLGSAGVLVDRALAVPGDRVKLAYRSTAPRARRSSCSSGSLGTTTALWEPQLAAFAGRDPRAPPRPPGSRRRAGPRGAVHGRRSRRAVLAVAGRARLVASSSGLSLGGMVGMWLGSTRRAGGDGSCSRAPAPRSARPRDGPSAPRPSARGHWRRSSTRCSSAGSRPRSAAPPRVPRPRRAPHDPARGLRALLRGARRLRRPRRPRAIVAPPTLVVSARRTR